MNCKYLIQMIALVPYFLKWADINDDGTINQTDVDLLMKLVK